MSRRSGRVAVDAGYVAAFDRLFAQGRGAVLSGTHHRDTPPVDGGRWGRCLAALARAAASCPPVRMRLGGLTLTPSGVMLCAFPMDDAADGFADRLGEALGPDGWFEET